MTTTLSSLEEALRNGDYKGMVSSLHRLDEQDKQKFSKKAVALLRKASKGKVGELPGNRYGWSWDLGEDVLKTCLNAALVTANYEQLDSLNWSFTLNQYFDWELLGKIKPTGLRQFGNILLSNNMRYFEDVRRLMSLGVTDKPTINEYYLGLISCPYSRSLKETLLKEEDLLDDVWMLFTIEGDQESSLASVDKYSSKENSWESTLVALSKEGHLSRDRLLDLSLEALASDFIQFRASWFSRFHEALTPTIEERRARLDKYGHLLGSSINPTVSFAVKALKKISAKHHLDAQFLKQHISPAVVAKSKSTVVGAFSLIERTIKKDHQFKNEGVLIIAEALIHESPEVQEKCLSILSKYGDKSDPRLLESLMNSRDLLAASVRESFNKEWEGVLISSGSSPIEDDATPQSVPYQFGSNVLDRWPFEIYSKLESIQTLDELIEQTAYCIENPRDALNFERVVAGISSVSVEYDREFEKDTSALKKRAQKFYGAPKYTISAQQRIAAGFVYAWLSPDESDILSDQVFTHPENCHRLWINFLRDIVLRVRAGKYLVPLSSPSHDKGWLDLNVLLDRKGAFESANCIACADDIVFAVSRIPSWQLESFLEQTSSSDQLIECLQFIAGKKDKCSIESQQLNAMANYLKKGESEVELNLGHGTIFDGDSDFETCNWLYLTMPNLRESFFFSNLSNARRCVEYMDVADLRLSAALERLCDSGAPLEKNALTLLAVSLVVERPECTGLACDAAILAIDESRLDLELFSQHVSLFLHCKEAKPKRLANSLAEISRISPMHSNAVRKVIEYSLVGDGSKAPKALASVLELYYELLVQEKGSFACPPMREYLEAVTTGGKTKKLIKQILATQ